MNNHGTGTSTYEITTTAESSTYQATWSYTIYNAATAGTYAEVQIIPLSVYDPDMITDYWQIYNVDGGDIDEVSGAISWSESGLAAGTHDIGIQITSDIAVQVYGWFNVVVSTCGSSEQFVEDI